MANSLAALALTILFIAIILLLVLAPRAVIMYFKGLNTWTHVCKKPKVRKQLVQSGDAGAVFMSLGSFVVFLLICLLSIYGHCA